MTPDGQIAIPLDTAAIREPVLTQLRAFHTSPSKMTHFASHMLKVDRITILGGDFVTGGGTRGYISMIFDEFATFDAETGIALCSFEMNDVNVP